MLPYSTASLLLFGAGSSLVAALPTTSPHNGTINWFPCTKNSTPVSGDTLIATCGSLAVPLDYTDPNCNQTLNLELLKYTAVKQPSRGSILFNPGGPGESTLEFLAAQVANMMVATSGYYDLIAFNTRGVGETLPFSCFDTAEERNAFNALVPTTTNNSDVSLGTAWSLGGVQAELCQKKMKENGELVSTAFIARDMMQIVDALGEDGLLRYYGFSYGTVLGATVAAMFPDRMDKVVLDGVVNIHEWLNGRNGELALQADAAIHAYFESCLSSPALCSLKRPNGTASSLYAEIVFLLEETKYNPIILGNNINNTIDHGTLKLFIYSQVKAGMGAGNGPLLSQYLNAIIERDVATYENLTATLAEAQSQPPIFPDNGAEALQGIQCPDTALRSDTLEGIRPQIEHNYNISYYGGVGVVQLLLVCAEWKMRSKETFTGPFEEIKTRNPILFVSSPLDPATPMASSWNMSRGFEGSVVLQQNGIGHCSVAQPSGCTIRATAAYFWNGTMPRNGTVCEPDFGFLSNHTTSEPYLLAAS